MPKFDKVVDHRNERVTTGLGGTREAATGKGAYYLLPPEGIHRLAKHYESGAKKYNPRNWEKGIPFSRCSDSMLRHAFQWLAGDMSEDHLAAVAWNAMAIMTYQERIEKGTLPADLDDMPSKTTQAAQPTSLAVTLEVCDKEMTLESHGAVECPKTKVVGWPAWKDKPASKTSRAQAPKKGKK